MSADADVIKEFLVRLGFEVDTVSLSGFVKGISGATAGALGFAVAIEAAAAAVFFAVKSLAEESNELALLAERLNTTTAKLDAFKDATSAMGIADEKAEASLISLNRAANDAALGIGRARLIFEKLGISVKDGNGKVKDTVALTSELAAKLKPMGRGQQINIMERLGLDASLIRYFNADLADLNEQLDRIDRDTGFDLGTTVERSQAFVKAWKFMSQEFRLIKTAIGKTIDVILTELMPDITDGLQRTAAWLRRVRDTYLQSAKAIIERALPIIRGVMVLANIVFRLISRIVEAFIGVAGNIITIFVKLHDATKGWSTAITAVIVAWRALNLAFLATPIGMIIAAGLALLLFIDDYQTWADGQDSLFDWGAFVRGVEMAISVLGKMYDIARNIFTMLLATSDLIAGVATLDLNRIKFAGGELFNAAQNAARTAATIGEPTPVQAAVASNPAQGGAPVAMNQVTNVTVQGAADPQATAVAVGNQQARVNDRLVRNMRGAVR